MSAKKIKRLEADKLISPTYQQTYSQDNLKNNGSSLSDDILYNSDSGSEENSFNDSDSESEENYMESEDDEFNLCDELAKWAIQFQISFAAINALLLVLLKCSIKVPKDARTLLKTPSSVIERKVGEGTYIHYGLKNGLTDFLVSNDYEGPAQFIRAAVRKVFSDELASLFSWKGTSIKPSAEKVYLITIIKAISHHKFKCTDKDMNAVLQKHFVHAKDRVNKRKHTN